MNGIEGNRSGGGGRSRLAFTLTELMVVIAVIILLAAITVGGVTRAMGKGKETRIRAELTQLITAIESYKEDIGSYPPDNPLNPAQPPLFYELSGVVVDNQTAEFRARGGGEVLRADRVPAYFGVEGFQNATMEQDRVKSFVNFRAEQYEEIGVPGDDVEVLVVPAPWPRAAAVQPIPGKPGVNPWRYRNPDNRMATNNPGGFELWAEYVDGKDVRIISNWRSDSYVVGQLVK